LINSQIVFLAESYYDLQKLRIETFNRIVAICGNNSQINTETHSKFASHEPDETQNSLPSQATTENQKENTEQPIEEKVKPSTIATQIIKGKIEVPADLKDLVWYHNNLFETEKQIKKKMDKWSSIHPLRVQYLDKIMGIGPIFASTLIAWLHPISRFDNISKLWSYCGLSAIHYECSCKGSKKNKYKKHKFLATSPHSECPVRIGTKREPCNAKVVFCERRNFPMKRTAHYLMMINSKLKTLMWKIASSFEKQNKEKSQYRRIYLDQKAKYLARPDLAKAIADKVKGAKLHVRLMSMRYVSKRFLADLWTEWRTIEGLEVTEPYAIAILKHSGKQSIKTDEKSSNKKEVKKKPKKRAKQKKK